jgi:hypothetical protein
MYGWKAVKETAKPVKGRAQRWVTPEPLEIISASLGQAPASLAAIAQQTVLVGDALDDRNAFLADEAAV